MRVRFQADADLKRAIVTAALRLEPVIDFRSALEADLAGLPDDEVLLLAAKDGRVLVTHDARTMPSHFGAFIARERSPGVVVVPQSLPVAEVAEQLVLIWSATDAEEWVDRLCWLPL